MDSRLAEQVTEALLCGGVNEAHWVLDALRAFLTMLQLVLCKEESLQWTAVHNLPLNTVKFLNQEVA